MKEELRVFFGRICSVPVLRVQTLLIVSFVFKSGFLSNFGYAAVWNAPAFGSGRDSSVVPADIRNKQSEFYTKAGTRTGAKRRGFFAKTK